MESLLIASIVVIVIGMVGLHMELEYSGWVLFLGCVGLFSTF